LDTRLQEHKLFFNPKRSNMKRILLLSFIAFLVSHFAWTQERSVSGKVTSAEDGSGLPGVNVIIKGTATGTVTDIEGNYKITVPEDGQTLVFSFIGLQTQEIPINNQSVIDVTMGADVAQLTEVVVTAIGIERQKKALGYSVENVDGEQVQQVSEPDVIRALQGKIAGVNISGAAGAPGASTRITIRGNSSFLGNNQPLFVVDGIPYDNRSNRTFSGLANGNPLSSGIAQLDPNNIESITVLKGASAAALYGTRAANGVVVVTTKTGSARAVSQQKLEVTYATTIALEQIARLPEYQNRYGTGTNFNFAFANGSWGAPFPGTVPYETIDSIPHPYPVTAGGRPGTEQFQGVMIPWQAQPDNVESVLEEGLVFENTLTISGGSDKARLTGTLSRLQNDGYIPNSEFDRTAISIGGRTQLENGISFGANLAFTKAFQRGPITGVGNLGGNNPSFFARTLLFGRNWIVDGREGFPFRNPVDGGSEFWVSRSQANHPLWSANFTGFTDETDRIVASLDAAYDFTDFLTVQYKVGINSFSTFRESFEAPGSTGPSSNPGVGQIVTDDIAFEEIESNLLITLSPEIHEDFSTRAIVGWNINQRQQKRQGFQGQNFAVPGIFDIDNTNNVVPNGPVAGTTGFLGNFKRRILGIYGDIQVGYRDFAFVTFTGRNDWSSTLPLDNNSFFYPAVTLSFLPTEAFDITSNILNHLKIRASWSEVGNDTDPFQLVPIFNVNTNPSITGVRSQLPLTPAGGPGSGTTFAGVSVEQVAKDANLLPEQTTEWEAGLEAGFLNDRIRVDFAYYYRESENQIANIMVAPSTGFTDLNTNFGVLTNEGVEIGLNLIPVQLPNGFTWEFYGTFTHNKNVVEELTEGLEQLQFGFTFAGTPINVLRSGEEFGVLRGTVNARDDEGNLLIDPANGQFIRALDEAIIGNPNPDFIVGLTNTFTYKGIRLNAVLHYKQGGDFWSSQIESIFGRGVLASQGDREQMRILPGVYGDPNTLEPIRGENGQKFVNRTIVEENTLWFGETFASNAASEWMVWDGTVIRLREITLGYDLPQSILEDTPFGMVNIAFTGRNLWLHTPNLPDDLNWDPEFNQFEAESNQIGLEFGTAPQVERWAGIVKVKF